jgi:hypothetical protein
VGADSLMLPDIECTTKRRTVPAATITGAVNVADVGSCDCDQPTVPTWAQPPFCSSVVYLQKGRLENKQMYCRQAAGLCGNVSVQQVR